MRKRFSSLLIFCTLCTSNMFAQVDFVDQDWKLTLEQSANEGKIIFVDTYTKWCGPCKKMDQRTFQDKEVGSFMNDNFINVKWNAESKDGAPLARKYDVRGYPTFLFMTADGKVIKRRSGFLKSSELIKLGHSVLHFGSTDHKTQVEKLLKQSPTDFSEISYFLSDNLGYKFAKKRDLYLQLYEYLQDKNDLSEDEIAVVIDNIYDLNQLKFAVKHFPNTKLDYDAHKNRNNQKSKIKSHINAEFKRALHSNDHKLMLELVQINLDFDDRINSKNLNGADKENNERLLEFYKKHKYQDEYFAQAEIRVRKYLSAYTPKMITEKDRLRQINKKRLAPKFDYQTPIYKTENQIRQKRKYAVQWATEFTRLSETSEQFFDQSEKLVVALSWAEQAEKYIDLPETRLVRAKILNRLGMKDEALYHVQQAILSELNDKELLEKLNYLKASLIN